MTAWDYSQQFDFAMWIVAALCVLAIMRDVIRNQGAKHWCEYEGCDEEANVLTNEHGWLCSLHFHEKG